MENFTFAIKRFITEIRKLDGSDFPAKTLYQIVICLQFHLEGNGFTWKLLDDKDFTEVRFTLDNIMKERVSAGIGIRVKKADTISVLDEEILWKNCILGSENPQQLLETVVYLVGLNCALRAGKEHRVLRSIPFDSQFTFLNDRNGKLYFSYVEDFGLKSNKGGLKHRKVEPKVVDVYQNCNIEPCPVWILQKYLMMLPSHRNCKRLYLQPRKKYTVHSWFIDAPVCENKLRSFVKTLCTKAGIPGFYTNHSLRSSSATRLYQGGVEEQVIQEITGHRSLAVRSYKHTSDEQREHASQTIFGNIKKC